MTAPTLIFLSLALLAIATAAGMLLSRNAVYAALFLILNFSTVALLYLLLGAPFIAMAQVTVYAGAIMVLFLFVIMLLGAEKLPDSKNLPWQRPVAIVTGLILLAEGIYLLVVRNWTLTDLPTPTKGYADPAEIGKYAFTIILPTLVINEKIVCSGRFPTKEEVIGWLGEAINKA